MTKSGLIFVQLSDFHTQNENSYLASTFPKIVDLILSKYRVQESMVLFCFSGDIAHSGSTHEYIIFESYLNKLREKVKNEKIENVRFLFIPGNHDVQFNGKSRTREDVIEFKKGLNRDKIIEENQRLREYYIFSNKNDSNPITSKQIDIIKLEHNGIKIRINRINSSLFSTLYLDKNITDESMGLHSLDYKQIERLNFDDTDYSVTLMHHNTSWFDAESKRRLESKLFTSNSFILTGHEHNQKTAESLSEGIDRYNSIAAGKYETDDVSINILFIDTRELKHEISKYKWNQELGIFSNDTNVCIENSIVKIVNANIRYKVEFLDYFYKDSYFQIDKNMFEYFNFPSLKFSDIKNEEMNRILDEFEDFKQVISDYNVISITGDPFSGKTALLKYLHYKSEKEIISLYFNAEEFNNQTIEKVVKDAFLEQFINQNGEYENFKQIKKEFKYAYIDNFHVLKEYIKPKVLSGFLTIFNKIFITSNIVDNSDMKKLLIDIIENDNHISFSIDRLYYDKRQELIEKVTKCLSEQLDITNIKNTSMKINSFINTHLDMASLHPYYVILFSKHLLESKNNIDAKENSFGFVFRNNLENTIKSHFESIAPDLTLTLFSKIAYHIHFNKKYPLSVGSFIDVIEKYKIDYRISKLDAQDFLNYAVKSRIIKKFNNSGYVFSSKSYLAFFVASEIIEMNNERLESGEEDRFDDLKQVANEVCFSINAQILLFISYLSKDNRYMMHIVNEAEKYANDWEKLDLENANIKYLDKFPDDDNYKAPTNDERQAQNKQLSKNEKRFVEHDLMVIDNLYDYRLEDLNIYANKIMKMIKLLDVVSKILPKFIFKLKSNKQDIIVDLVYSLPNKLAYALFKPIDDNFNDFVTALHDEFSNQLENNISKEKVEEIIKIFTITSILSLYFRTIFSSYDENTREALLSYNANNLNEKLQKLFVYEISDRSKNMSVLSDEMVKVYEYLPKSNINRTMLKHILKIHHSFVHNLVSHGPVQKIRSILYPGKEQSYILNKPKDKKKSYKKSN